MAYRLKQNKTKKIKNQIFSLFLIVYFNTGMDRVVVSLFLFACVVERFFTENQLRLFVNICEYVASVSCGKPD